MRITDFRFIFLLLGFLAGHPGFQSQRDEAADREQALRARFEQALMSNPSRGTAFERLYQLYADGPGVTAWSDRLQQLADSNAKQAWAPLLLGFVRESQGDDQGALESYAEAERREPGNYRAPAARARLLMHLRRYEEATHALARSVTLKPPRQELQDLYKSLGRVHSLRG